MADIAHFYAEGNTAQTTTSATFVDVDTTNGRIAAASLSADTKYLIVARALIGVDSAANMGYFRVQTADDTNIATKSASSYEFVQTTGTGLKSWFFVHSFTTDGTPDDIDLQYMVDGSSTMTCDQYSLLAIDLDAVGFSELYDESNAVADYDILGGTGTGEEWAQSFKVNSSHNLDRIRVWASKTGTPTDNLTMEVSASMPPVLGQNVATSDTVAASGLTGSSAWTDFVFSAPAGLTAGTLYWWRLVRSGSRDVSNYASIGVDTSGTYRSGIGQVYEKSSGSWAAKTGEDFVFHALSSTVYHEDINAATGTELDVHPTGTTMSTITAATLGSTENWVFLGCGKVGVGSTGRWFRVQVGFSNITGITSQEEGEDTTEERMMGGFGIYTTSDNYALAVDGRENHAAGNFTDEGSYLVALPLSHFAEYVSDWTYAGLSVATTETTLATSGSYTPTVDGNHLILGAVGAGFNEGALLQLHVEDAGTEIRTGDSTPTHNQLWDSATDQESAYTMQRYSIAGNVTLNLRGLSDVDPSTMSERTLIVINLADPTFYPPFPRHKQTVIRM